MNPLTYFRIPCVKRCLKSIHQNLNIDRSYGTSLRIPTSMTSWQINDFSGITSLELVDKEMPSLNQPNEMLIEVKAASINVLDVMMTGR